MATFSCKLKSGRNAYAQSRYITGRVGKEKKSEVVCAEFIGAPAWAEGSASTFWRAADKGERRNGAAFRELVIALPLELGLEAQRDLVLDIAHRCLGPKTCEFAIHHKQASIGECPQPHVHLMYSDRLPDEHVRPPSQYFRRYNPDQPAKGGCKKDSGGKTPVEVPLVMRSLRRQVAESINDALEKAGHSARVDPRSYRERGSDCIAEPHFGSVAISRMSEADKAAIRVARAG